MSDAKRSISLLCRILSLGGVSCLVAEGVRQAKFNKLRGTTELWQTLHRVTVLVRESSALEVERLPSQEPSSADVCCVPCSCTSEGLSLKPMQSTHQGGKDQSADTRPPEQVRISVSHTMWLLRQLGYFSTPFWTVLADNARGLLCRTNAAGAGDPETETIHNSRIPLITLFWVLGSFNVAECLVNQLELRAGAMRSLPHTSTSKTAPVPRSEGEVTLPPKDVLHKLVAQTGRLRSTCHQLKALSEDHARLSHRVMSFVQPAAPGASISAQQSVRTVDDVCLLFDQSRLERSCRVLRDANTIFALTSAWQNKEEVFWAWAESVIQEEMKSPTQPGLVSAQPQASSDSLLPPCTVLLSSSPILRVIPVLSLRCATTLSASHRTDQQCTKSASHRTDQQCTLSAYALELGASFRELEARRGQRTAQSQRRIQSCIERNKSLVFLS